MQQSNQTNLSASYNENLVRNSNLDPTGAEFYPTNPGTSSHVSNNTIQQPKHKPVNKGNKQYGSGRTRNYYSKRTERNDGIVGDNHNATQRRHEDARFNLVDQGRYEHGYGNGTYNRNVRDYGNYSRNSAPPDTSVNSEYNISKGKSVVNGGRSNYQRNNSNNRDTKKYHSAPRKDNFYRNDPSDTGNDYNRYGNYRNETGDRDNVGDYGRRGNNRNSGLPTNKFSDRTDDRSKSWRRYNNDKKAVFSGSSTKNKKLDAASQRERLVEMLNRRLLECLVCCEKIKEADRVWSCTLCFHILHLRCLAAWANSSKLENGWRCPACQNVYNEVPKRYECYCGKVTDPKYTPGMIPHSCGSMCLKEGKSCSHKCTLQCHPGPCPDCDVMVSRECGCGQTKQTVKCNSNIKIVCESVCDKLLSCRVHTCKLNCHPGDCEPCSETIQQECYCGKVGRKVPCRPAYVDQKHYSCEEVCGKKLSCGNHTCQKLCHDGPCSTCETDVNVISSCPCGKMPLEHERNTCLDPIPCCGEVCGRILKCGVAGEYHTCQEKCHGGNCPSCLLSTVVRCRCAHMNKEISCQELEKNPVVTCEKKCTKKRLCGKHKCNQFCCIEIDHACPLPCNRQLTCGKHKCELTCHSGRCLPCMETSFEELYCECGASVLYPPISCGTKPPSCNKPCSRPRPCGHEVNHACHTGPCPPCTVMVKRWCYGRHEQRAAILCHQENFSCGIPCGKNLPCGRHKCIKFCHDGACPLPCKQPCVVPRTLCGHPCGAACHDPPCPFTDCKANVPITCLCGLQKSTKPCLEVAEEFKNMQMSQMKDKMGLLSKEQTVDISDVNSFKKPSVLKILECTEECRVLERNRRLAIGLQIRNPDLGQKLMPRYSDFLKQWSKKDPGFCQRVHDKLTELVELAKQSKQKSRSFSFESMNRDKRHMIHELAQYFGIETEAYDAEPNRNVVATAIKDKSWLPSMSLNQVMQRENGHRKVPGPISTFAKSALSPESVSLKLPSNIYRPIGDAADSNQRL